MFVVDLFFVKTCVLLSEMSFLRCTTTEIMEILIVLLVRNLDPIDLQNNRIISFFRH